MLIRIRMQWWLQIKNEPHHHHLSLRCYQSPCDSLSPRAALKLVKLSAMQKVHIGINNGPFRAVDVLYICVLLRFLPSPQPHLHWSISVACRYICRCHQLQQHQNPQHVASHNVTRKRALAAHQQYLFCILQCMFLGRIYMQFILHLEFCEYVNKKRNNINFKTNM